MNLNKFVRLVLYFLTVLLVFSCEYDNDRIFSPDINQDIDDPELNINLNLNSDTIYVYSNSKINVSFNPTDAEIYDVKFFVNNKEYPNVDRVNNSFTLNLSISKTYNIKIRAEIYSSTGTGSIADKVRAEALVTKTQEWVLVYCPDKLEIKTEIQDGRLKLSWTPIKNVWGQQYLVYSSGKLDSTYNTWYIDSNYFGGQSNISVRYDDKGISGYAIYDEVNYSYPYAYIANSDSFLICWEKCKFYNNIKGYQIRIDDFIKEIPNSDTSNRYKDGLLGSAVFVELGIRTKKEDASCYYFTTLHDYYPASLLEDQAYHTKNFFPAAGSSFYYSLNDINGKKLKKYSLVHKSITGSLAIDFDNIKISAHDKYILCQKDYNIYFINPENLKIIKTVPLSNIIKTPFYLNSNCTISDIGTSVFVDPRRSSFVIFDFINDSVIDTIPIPPDIYLHEFKFSAKGNFLFDPRINTLFKIDNNTHSTVWSNEAAENQYKYFEFSPDDLNQIALYDGTIFTLKNCNDFTTIKSYSLGSKTVINVDFEAQKILATSGDAYYIYSLTDGSLLNTIPFYIEDENSHLFNNHLINWNVQVNLNSL